MFASPNLLGSLNGDECHGDYYQDREEEATYKPTPDGGNSTSDCGVGQPQDKKKYPWRGIEDQQRSGPPASLGHERGTGGGGSPSPRQQDTQCATRELKPEETREETPESGAKFSDAWHESMSP
jgi:hypothetical protein